MNHERNIRHDAPLHQSFLKAIAAIYKKDWRWWVVGIVILAVALFFYWDNQTSAELRSGQKE